MKCRLLRDMERAPETPKQLAAFRTTGKLIVVPKGTVIDHPDAHMLVSMGVAEPADEECEPYRLSPQAFAAAEAAYNATAAGIAPEDLQAFHSGQITGYNPDGSVIPGPNYVEPEEETEEDELYVEEQPE
jgi:hypothetical protein